eukprot:Awhi_evm1s12648
MVAEVKPALKTVVCDVFFRLGNNFMDKKKDGSDNVDDKADGSLPETTDNVDEKKSDSSEETPQEDSSVDEKQTTESKSGSDFEKVSESEQ